MVKYIYNCPIRKEFKSNSIEEKHRIDCLNYFIKTKKVPKENISIEKTLQIYGSSRKNNLIADIVIYDGEGKSIKNILYVIEIKANQKHKENAIKYQLLPAIKLCENIIFGIYWDEVNRIVIDKNNTFFSLADINYKKQSNQKEFDQLQKIKNTQSIWLSLELCLRNYQGGQKNKHREILKLLIMKYYDEKFNEENLVFNLKRYSDKSFKKLYRETLEYYDRQNIFQNIFTGKIELNTDCIKKSIEILQNYSLIKSDDKIIQEFYMCFAPSFLKKDLSQYYTPKEIADFMVSLIKLEKKTKALDPCSGSGDFMVGILKRAKEENLKEMDKNISCWDIDEDASVLSQINMILNGDGRTEVHTKNSLQNINEHANQYDLIITNPPFGKNTTYKDAINYTLETIESGKLFIERSFVLLKEKGHLVIILPNGYLENPSDEFVRDYILNNSKIIGIVNLPNNVFKSTGSGGRTSILIAQKTNEKFDNYTFFVDKAEKVGFDHKKKYIPPLYKKDALTGSLLHNEENDLIVENDLLEIKKKFDKFLENGGESNTMNYKDVIYSKYKRFCIAKYLPKYEACIRKIKQRKYSNLSQIGAKVSNKKNFEKTEKDQYNYIETGDVYRDYVLNTQTFRGWKLPNRAKIKVVKNTILLSKMEGTFNNFMYYANDSNLIVSNGFYSIEIDDEKKRFNFFRFLFTEDYIIQMEALTTGTIMADVKRFDLISALVFPVDNIKNNYIKTKNYLDYKSKLIDFKK